MGNHKNLMLLHLLAGDTAVYFDFISLSSTQQDILRLCKCFNYNAPWYRNIEYMQLITLFGSQDLGTLVVSLYFVIILMKLRWVAS